MARYGTGRKGIPGLHKLSSAAYYTYYLKLLDMLLNRFKYTGVPDTMDIRYLELQLIQNGEAIIFKDDFLGLCGFGVTYDGYPDQYGVPINRQAISANGQPFMDLTPGNSVLVYNNRMRVPDIQTCVEYAKRLYEIQRSIDTNILLQKYSGLVITDEGQRLTMQNVIAKWQGDAPIVFAAKEFNKEAFTPLGFDIPFVGDQLYTLKNRVYNEFLTFMGIINTSNDKRERLVATEALAPMGSIEMARNSYLNERKKAVEQVNKMFGTEIDVEFDSCIPLNPDEGGAINERIYNTTSLPD